MYSLPRRLPDQPTTERDFFSSLAHLAGFYGFTPLDVGHYPFPQNILFSFDHAKRQICGTEKHNSLWWHHSRGGVGEAGFLVATEQVEYCDFLYYLPVIPLYTLLRTGNPKVGGLLLSVFAYLYQKAGLPYYLDPDTAMCYSYECIAANLGYEWPEDTPEAQLKETIFTQSTRCGELIQRKIQNPLNLTFFPQRVANFRPCSDREFIAADIAKGFLALYQKYPERTLFDHLEKPDLETEDAYTHPLDTMAFICSRKSWIFEELQYFAESTYSESLVTINPRIERSFLQAVEPGAESLDFERSVIGLLYRLIHLLNHLQ